MNESDNKLARWMNGELQEGELQSIATEREIAEYKKILNQLDNWEPIENEAPFDIDQFIEDRYKSKSKKFTFKAYSKQIMAMAAALTLILAVLFIFKFYGSNETVYIAGIGESKEVTLPDNTKVHLAANSKISFVKDGWMNERKINLSGRAYFHVKKKGPFKVNLPLGSVEVLGTKFEVHESLNMMTVSCFEGAVKAIGNKKEQTINALESVLFDSKEGWKKKRKITNSEPGWLTGVNQFSNVPLIQVIDALEDQFGLTIQVSEGINKTELFTGYFPNNDKSLALKLVFEPFNIGFEEIKENVILLKKK